MNALEWLRAPSRGAIRSVCAVFGDDTYLVRESVSAVGRAVFPDDDQGSGISRFPGPGTALASVLDEARTLPFFSRERLVIVDDADPFVTKYRKELEAYTEKPCESGILLLQTKQWLSTTRLAKLVEKVGLAIDCSSPREGDLGPLAKRARASSGSRPSSTPRAPGSCSSWWVPRRGSSSPRSRNCLSTSANRDGSSERTSLNWSGPAALETVWKTLDALAGQGRVALEHLDSLIADGEDPVGLLAAMSRQPAQGPPRWSPACGAVERRRSVPPGRHSAVCGG